MLAAWRKLDRLRYRCDAEIRSFLDGERLCWRVAIQRPEQQPVVVVRPEIQDAVALAVAEAEKRGWIEEDHAGNPQQSAPDPARRTDADGPGESTAGGHHQEGG